MLNSKNLVIAATFALSLLRKGSGSPSRLNKKVFKKFLKALKESEHAQECEIEFMKDSQKTHFKFKGRNRLTGDLAIWVTSKTTSDKRTAANRKSSIRHVMGISDIPKQFFNF